MNDQTVLPAPARHARHSPARRPMSPAPIGTTSPADGERRHQDEAELAVVRRLTRDLRPAAARRYVIDVTGAALGAWIAWGVAAWTDCPPGLRLASLATCSALLYRALMFIHELYHQPALHSVRHLWHLLVGIPALLPLLLYQPVHHLHHRPDSYGTVADGEYEQLEGRSRRMALKLLVLNLGMPLAMLVRFGLLGPLGWILPVVRREFLPRFAHLTMRMPFTAPPLRGAAAAEAARIDIACTLWAWLLIVGLFTGHAALVATWAVALIGVATLNTLRALGCTHLYRERDEGRDALGQTADSVNVEGNHLLTRILCPIGLQYHALHHIAPSLPYHALPEAHRRLVSALPAESVYRQSSVPSLWQGWLRVVRTCDPAAGTSAKCAGIAAGPVSRRPGPA